MFSVLNTLSEYTYFYISKSITSYTFCLFLKSSKAFSVSLNDMHNSIRFSSPFHSADGTVLLTKLPIKTNKDLWLNANKIALDQAKTEQNYDGDLKIQLCRKKIHDHRMLNISKILSIKTLIGKLI